MGSTFFFNAGEQNADENKLYLSFGLFFDGTLNNKTNTEQRIKHRDGTNHIEDTDDKDTVLKKEEALNKIKKQEDKKFGKLSDSDILPTDTEYQQFLKASHWNGLGVDTSFGNDYTNVARMWKCSENQEYAIYIEGIGTLDKLKDVDDGFQYGSGFSGIRGKVRTACEKLAEKIKKIKNGGDSRDKKIDSITIDVFGFSRGAAAARNFIHEVNVKRDYAPAQETIQTGYRKEMGYNPRSRSVYTRDVPQYGLAYYDSDGAEVDAAFLINGKLPKMGHLGYSLLKNGVVKSKEELEQIRIKIRFVGLYDTVASYKNYGDMGWGNRTILKGGKHIIVGPTRDFKHNVEELQLDNLGYMAKAVHFTALNEHRENFPLTRMKTGIEKNLPGVHCDIGGAYETGTEIVDEIETSNHKPLWLLGKYKELLIEEKWFTEDEIKIKNKVSHAIFGALPWVGNLAYMKIRGERFLRKEYSYIPLHFMEDLCLPYMKDNMIKDRYPSIYYPIGEQDAFLLKVKAYLENYVFGDALDCGFLSPEELAKRKELIARGNREREIMNDERSHADELAPGRYIPKVPANLEQENYIPKTPNAPPPPQHTAGTTDTSAINGGTLDEVVVVGYKNPKAALLWKLRHEYLHWSANRDWIGMDPTDNYIRAEY